VDGQALERAGDLRAKDERDDFTTPAVRDVQFFRELRAGAL
jgi:hypothetical protein